LATKDVYVYGNKYKVMSVDSELVTNAAQYVEDTMRQYEKEGHVLTTSKLAVMAAIKDSCGIFTNVKGNTIDAK